MKSHDLIRRLHDQPFKPFRIQMCKASQIDVLEPGSIIVGESSAVVPTAFGKEDRGNRIALDWKTIAIAHIVEFVDFSRKNGNPRGK